jgi:hypothetical protein
MRPICLSLPVTGAMAMERERASADGLSPDHQEGRTTERLRPIEILGLQNTPRPAGELCQNGLRASSKSDGRVHPVPHPELSPGGSGDANGYWPRPDRPRSPSPGIGERPRPPDQGHGRLGRGLCPACRQRAPLRPHSGGALFGDELARPALPRGVSTSRGKSAQKRRSRTTWRGPWHFESRFRLWTTRKHPAETLAPEDLFPRPEAVMRPMLSHDL